MKLGLDRGETQGAWWRVQRAGATQRARAEVNQQGVVTVFFDAMLVILRWEVLVMVA